MRWYRMRNCPKRRATRNRPEDRPKARAGVDAFLTVNYGDYADPAALLSTIVLPGGSQNYDNYNDPKTTALLEQVGLAARG